MMLFYEQMAYMLKKGISYKQVIIFLNNYDKIFPEAKQDRSYYWDGVKNHLLAPTQKDRAAYNRFMEEAAKIIKKKVNHVISQIVEYLTEKRGMIEFELQQLSIDELRNIAIEARYKNECEDIERQQYNILRFRPHD